jgi:PAS domain S-box-containing protein
LRHVGRRDGLIVHRARRDEGIRAQLYADEVGRTGDHTVTCDIDARMASPFLAPGTATGVTPWHLTAAVLLATIFIIDITFPVGIHVPALYVLPCLLFIWAGRFQEPLIAAAVATVLTMAGFFASASGEDDAIGLANRALDIGLIWLTAGFLVAHVRVTQTWTRQMTDANQALQNSMRRLQDIQYALDQSAIVAATDHRGIINYVNDKFCEISKYSREELLGQDHRIINSGYHSKEFIRSIWHTIAQGGVWRGELRNRAKDGSIYWVDTTIVPFLNERGKPWQYLSIRNDITQRKAAEERLRAEAALTQMGRLSAVVAHEVRNPLAGLKGSLQILASRLPPDLPGRQIITPMLARIDALEQKVQDILTYVRPSTPKKQRFEMRTLVAETIESARAAVKGSAIRLTDGHNAVVEADPELCRAILLNLIVNAAQASDGEPVDVSVRSADGHVETVVADRGRGIPADIRDQLFEPFVTTKPGGTGLGLAIARRLTHLQGGTLTLADRSNGGTEATLALPIAEAASASRTPP